MGCGLALGDLRCRCDPANVASVRVLQKLGMRHEGHLIENAWIKGAWVDSLIYAILVPPLCLLVLVGLMATEADYTFNLRQLFFH